jgi:hypothetical protein
MDTGTHLEEEGGLEDHFEGLQSGNSQILWLSCDSRLIEGEVSIQEQEKGEAITIQVMIPLLLLQLSSQNLRLRSLQRSRKLKPTNQDQESHTRTTAPVQEEDSVGDLEDERVDTEGGVEDLLGELFVGEIKHG